ncbi:MAG: pyridoxamine 5'-phosphate oxidase family protein [bacterium]
METLDRETLDRETLDRETFCADAFRDEWEGVWNALRDGVATRKSPFHTFTLATVNEEGEPDARTVILRGADETERVIACQGDIRSPKFRQTRLHSTVVAVLYSVPDKRQIRLRGSAEIRHEDTHTEARWSRMYPMSREVYRTPFAPGELLSGDSSQISDPVPLEQAYHHFATIQIKITEIDTLFLSADGHRRTRFDCSTGHPITAHRIAP